MGECECALCMCGKSDNQRNYTHYFGRISFYFLFLLHTDTQEDLFIHVWRITKRITRWQHEISFAVNCWRKKAIQSSGIYKCVCFFLSSNTSQVLSRFLNAWTKMFEQRKRQSNCSDENGILRNFFYSFVIVISWRAKNHLVFILLMEKILDAEIRKQSFFGGARERERDIVRVRLGKNSNFIPFVSFLHSLTCSWGNSRHHIHAYTNIYFLHATPEKKKKRTITSKYYKYT